jgi:hypothetical protein
VEEIKKEAEEALERCELAKAIRGMTINSNFNEEDSVMNFWDMVGNDLLGVNPVSVGEAVTQEFCPAAISETIKFLRPYTPNKDRVQTQAISTSSSTLECLLVTFHDARWDIPRSGRQDEERLVYVALATRGYLRQEENQYLANDLEKITELSIALQRFAGFGASKPYMGWVEMEEPVKILNGEEAGEVEFW